MAYIAIPDEVEAILDLNTKMNPTGKLRERFVEGIRTAVQASLEYKPTSMRHLTDQEMKRRVTVCMEIFKQLYWHYVVDHLMLVHYAVNINGYCNSGGVTLLKNL